MTTVLNLKAYQNTIDANTAQETMKTVNIAEELDGKAVLIPQNPSHGMNTMGRRYLYK